MLTRKSSLQLNAQEKSRFVSVLSLLISAPGDPNPYGELVALHREHMKYLMHPQMGENGVQRFLPWHRVFLLKAEKMAQQIDPEFFVPYWDWRVERSVPDWLVNFKPTIRVPGNDVTVTRDPPRLGVNLPTKEAIDNVMKADHFRSFVLSIDPPHGAVHNWVNGTMSDFSDSPNDPLFWLHHAMIDKLWSVWQAAYPNEGPTLAGKWRKMIPWEETYSDIKDIAALGYQYL